MYCSYSDVEGWTPPIHCSLDLNNDYQNRFANESVEALCRRGFVLIQDVGTHYWHEDTYYVFDHSSEDYETIYENRKSSCEVMHGKWFDLQ